MAETTPTASASTSATKTPPSVTMPSVGAPKINLSPNGNILVWVEGRIQQVNQVAETKDGQPIFETVVLMPAADQYTAPKRYCVSSYARMGRAGDDLAVDCELVCQPWRPRSNNNNRQGNPGNNGGNYNDGYAGNNYQRQGNSNGRWHYPHYLWALR